MATHLLSVRFPDEVVRMLEESAVEAGLTIPEALDWLLSNSFANFLIIRNLADCREQCDAKLDARIPATTLDQLRVAAAQLEFSISVYTRRLLYHFYITERLQYVQSEGRYTLAYRHD